MKIVEKLTNEELMNNTDYTTQCFKGNSKEELIDELFREYCYNHKIKDKEKLKKRYNRSYWYYNEIKRRYTYWCFRYFKW